MPYSRRPLAPAEDAAVLCAEIAALPPGARLAHARDLCVWAVRAHQTPALMREIGRLREETFRAVGEGTGLDRDLDAFDAGYVHLVLWDAAARCVAGGYRLGLVDERTAVAGPSGIYLHTLYDLSAEFLDDLGPAIELGRSFVTLPYQRGYAPLLLLWQAISTFVAHNPRYRSLIGPVSVSADYTAESRALIAAVLQRPEWRSVHYGRVRPRRSFFAGDRAGPLLMERAFFVQDFAALSAAVSELEPDGKGAPILLKHYLRMGARTVAFGVDPEFSFTMDVLCVLDLPSMDVRMARRLMGGDAWERYRGHHRPAPELATVEA